MKAITALLLVFTFSIIICISCCQRIDSGHEGILVAQYGTDRGVQEIPIVTGRVWYNPITYDVFEFPTYVRTVDYDTFTVNAKGGSIFSVDPIVSYCVIEGKSPYIFKKYRKSIDEIEQTVLLNYIKDAFKNVFNSYTSDSILSQRQQFDDEVSALLVKQLEKEGFRIDQLTFGMFYPKSLNDAIDAKNAMLQETQKRQNEIAKTKADSTIKIINASAEALANKMRQQTLSALLIQQQFIEKWDGKTPLYGNVPNFFMNIKQ